MFKYLEKQSRATLYIIGFAMVLITGYLDFFTGYEISMSVFYLMPILLVTWFGSEPDGVFFAVICAFIEYKILNLQGFYYSHSLTPLWNVLVEFGIFLIVVHTLSVRKETEKILKEKTQALERSNMELRVCRCRLARPQRTDARG